MSMSRRFSPWSRTIADESNEADRVLIGTTAVRGHVDGNAWPVMFGQQGS